MTRILGLAWFALVVLLLALWQARRRKLEAWSVPIRTTCLLRGRITSSRMADPIVMEDWPDIQPPDPRTWELLSSRDAPWQITDTPIPPRGRVDRCPA